MIYQLLGKASVVVYLAMSVAAFYEGDLKRGTLALLFGVANAIMFVL